MGRKKPGMQRRPHDTFLRQSRQPAGLTATKRSVVMSVAFLFGTEWMR